MIDESSTIFLSPLYLDVMAKVLIRDFLKIFFKQLQ